MNVNLNNMKEIKSTVKESGLQKFYEFSQNNTGGSFVTNSQVCHRLLIEAASEAEAELKAESMGVYFNGVDEGMDCPCCGDRWYSGHEVSFPRSYGSMTEKEAASVAEKYGASVAASKGGWKDRNWDVVFATPESYAQYLADEYGWTSPDVRIFRSDGSVVEIYPNR
jgi:hypothetical protein